MEAPSYFVKHIRYSYCKTYMCSWRLLDFGDLWRKEGIKSKEGINSLTTRDENSWIANSVDLDEVAHDEPPHQDLHCLPSSLWMQNMI